MSRESTTDDGTTTVLVVDDDRDLAETCRIWLEDAYEVETAYDGESALEVVDDAVDVVLLDRRMPGTPGDEVLAELRRRNLDCRVSMLTAVEPNTDIAAMQFDEYLVKPVRKQEVRETVADLAERAELSQELREYYATAAKLGALRSSSADIDPEDDTLADLRERREELASAVESHLDGPGDYEDAFEEV